MAVAELTELRSKERPGNLWLDALRHLLEKRSAVVGLTLLSFLALVALLAPVP